MIGCNDAKVQQYLTMMNEANLSEFSMQLGMRGEVYDGSEVKWVYTGGKGINRILNARFADEEAEDRISDLLRMFESRDSNPHWITGPSTTPCDIPERLERRGFRRLEWTGMAMELKDLPEDVPQPNGLRVREVKDISLLRPWADVLCTGFHWPAHVHQPVYELFAGLGVRNAIPWRHYIGYLHDQPASVCTVYEGSGALGVYMVAVIPEARRQGVGMATTWHALRDCLDLGHCIAVLQASPMGRGVYENIGFSKHCDMGLYGR